MNPNWAYDILRNDPNHKDREALEQTISTSAEYSCLYAEHVIEGRWELGEYVISKDAEYSCEYAKYVIEARFVLGEAAISEDAYTSFNYANNVIKGRFELGEAAISQEARSSYFYARDIIEGRFELGESAISQEARWSYEYAKDVIQGRLPDIMHRKMLAFGIMDSSDEWVKEYFATIAGIEHDIEMTTVRPNPVQNRLHHQNTSVIAAMSVRLTQKNAASMI